MSHFTSLKTKLVEKKHLLAALQDLGYEFEEGMTTIRGYLAQRIGVDVRVATADPEYDIGFRWAGNAYECVADWESLKRIKPQAFVDKISQRYAYHAAMEKLTEQGFSVASEVTERDGRIHLVLRRTT